MNLNKLLEMDTATRWRFETEASDARCERQLEEALDGLERALERLLEDFSEDDQ